MQKEAKKQSSKNCCRLRVLDIVYSHPPFYVYANGVLRWKRPTQYIHRINKVKRKGRACMQRDAYIVHVIII